MKKSIHGLILAGGFSSRMDGFKPLVRYKNITFIEHIINKLLPLCERVLIVTGFNGDILEERVKNLYQELEPSKIEFVRNENFQEGMFSSVKTGVKSLLPTMSEFDYVMLHLVDQPHISENIYDALAAKTRNEKLKVLLPSYNMKVGHPIVLSKAVLEDVVTEPDSCNLREILKKWQHDTTYINIEDKSVLEDVNTPEERKEYLE